MSKNGTESPRCGQVESFARFIILGLAAALLNGPGERELFFTTFASYASLHLTSSQFTEAIKESSRAIR